MISNWQRKTITKHEIHQTKNKRNNKKKHFDEIKKVNYLHYIISIFFVVDAVVGFCLLGLFWFFGKLKAM